MVYMDQKQFRQALKTILDDLRDKLEGNEGIGVFVKNRDKFEGWLKVETVDILYNKFTENVVPEKRYYNKNANSKKRNKHYRIVDIVFDDSALELKTVNTNYKHIKNKKVKRGNDKNNRPITLNIKQLKADIEKLRNLQNEDIKNKAVLFVVFPLPENNIEEFENYHLQKLGLKKQDILSKEFTTNGDVSNRIYYGIVREQ